MLTETLIDLKTIQKTLYDWQIDNFSQTKPEWLVLGALEELGELAHIILKKHQAIRGFDHMPEEKLKALIEDAVADTVIYLINFCSSMDIDFETALKRTVEEVTKRKWKRTCT